MINKTNLIKELEKLIALEEAIIPVLRDHLSSAFSFSGADKDKTEEFQQTLQELADREQKHFNMLKELKQNIEDKTDLIY